MNRIFRIIRNPQTGECSVASELATRRGKRTRHISLLAAGVAASLGTSAAAANLTINYDHVLSGPSASQTVDGNVMVGSAGTGSLTVSDGAQFSSINGVTAGFLIGQKSSDGLTDGHGEVSVTGQGSTLGVETGLMVGTNAEGSLVISDGGTVQNGTYAYIGWSKGGEGTARISGAGSLWKMDGAWMMVGSAGTGRLTIEDGGKMIMENASTLSSRVGDGAHGEMYVSGADSEWRSNGDLSVGEASTGVLDVSQEGSISAAKTITLGNLAAGSGSASVSSGGQLAAGGMLSIGRKGIGRLAVGAGGIVTSKDAVVGKDAYGQGDVTVSGPGAQWNTGGLVVGDQGNGAMLVTDDGEVLADGKVTLGKGGRWRGQRLQRRPTHRQQRVARWRVRSRNIGSCC